MAKIISAAQVSPSTPNSPASKMTQKRNKMLCSYSDGTASVAMVAAAAIVSTGTLTIPASTAVSPMMSAPTMLTVWLMDCGARRPASRTISNSSVTASISSIGGSGVWASAWASLVSSCTGMISGAKATAITYSPGPNTDKRNARYFNRRMSPAKTAPEA